MAHFTYPPSIPMIEVVLSQYSYMSIYPQPCLTWIDPVSGSYPGMLLAGIVLAARVGCNAGPGTGAYSTLGEGCGKALGGRETYRTPSSGSGRTLYALAYCAPCAPCATSRSVGTLQWRDCTMDETEGLALIPQSKMSG